MFFVKSDKYFKVGIVFNLFIDIESFILLFCCEDDLVLGVDIYVFGEVVVKKGKIKFGLVYG